MENLDIGYLIKRISDKMKATMDADLKQNGLTFSQIRVLGFLDQRNGIATQKQIETYLGVSHPTVVGLVTRMEKNGFLVCYRDEKNRRNKIVSTTEKARHIEHTMLLKRQMAEQKLVQGISESEVKQLKNLLSIVLENLKGNEIGR